MKFILTIALWMTGLALLAQPVFEHSYSESTTIRQLDKMGEFYYSMDVITKQCHFYNMDHTLLKSIHLLTPEGYYLADIQYVSEHLFNDDDQVELVYIFSKYMPAGYYYIFSSKVINENGTLILDLPGIGFTEVIETSDGGKKFLAYKYDYSVIPYRTYTDVYSLPGKDTKSATYRVESFGPGEAYPNPAGELVNIPVSLPEGVPSGTLEVTDLGGRSIFSFPVTGSTTNVVMPTSHLAPGTYIYKLNAGSWHPAAKKVIIRE